MNRLLAHIALIMLLAACAARTPEAVVKPEIPRSEAACLAAGGEWKRLGIPCDTCPKSCDLPTTDAGSYCTDLSHCQGACLAEDEQAASGKCAARRQSFGCHYFMNDGTARRLCAD